jgi:hypothetical protein
MPIKFPCPHCKKVLSVKDHLAGKKGTCPVCKKIVTVPSQPAPPATVTPAEPPAPTNGQTAKGEPAPPAAPPPEDAEAAAAAALADEPPKEVAAPQFVDFNCPMCDEPLHLSAELAGKRTPCPECRRIIKVPEIKKVEKIDWRKTNAQGLPSGARRPDEPAPEGAWGTATSASTVSREALEEADVLPDRYYRPLTTRQKVMRGVFAAAGLGVVLFILVLGVGWWLSSREARALKDVESYAGSEAAKKKVGPEGVAALYAALGEYHLRSKRPGGSKEAQAYFQKAVEVLTPQGGEAAVKESERDALLADVALLQADLGAGQEKFDKQAQFSWHDTQLAVSKTLRAMRHGEARLEAYRAVCRRLLAHKQADHAFALAAQISDAGPEKQEAVAVAGLEMLAANRQTFADRAAEELKAALEQDEAQTLTPSAVALGVALNRKLPGKSEDEDSEALGRAVSRARLNQWDKARDDAAAITGPEMKLRAYVELAAAGEAKADNPDLDRALKMATTEVARGKLPWLKLRLAELAARAGVGGDHRFEALVAAIDDRDLAARARLAALRHKLAAAKGAGSESPLPADPPTLAHYLSVELLARRNRTYDSKADDADRAFGAIGALLGGLPE